VNNIFSGNDSFFNVWDFGGQSRGWFFDYNRNNSPSPFCSALLKTALLALTLTLSRQAAGEGILIIAHPFITGVKGVLSFLGGIFC
jgi:hypothetical protein